ELARVLSTRGASSTVVDAGASTDDVRRAWARVAPHPRVSAVHLSLLDHSTANMSAQALAGTLHTAAQLAEMIVSSEERAARDAMWFVTRGAQSVAGESCSPAQATVWGLGRTVA